MQTITLSRKLVISSEDEAKQYQLELLYKSYTADLDFHLDYRGIQPGKTIRIDSQFEINAALNTLYADKFASVLKRVKPFVDLRDMPIDIEHIHLACKTFIRSEPSPVVFIFMETIPMVVVDTHNDTKVLKNPNTADGNPLLSVELDKFTVIATIKE